jgi:hypothetical protein
MKRYYQQGRSKFSFERIVNKTDKATLFEIISGIQIWVPNSWLLRLNDKSFIVKDHIATEIKLKIMSEQKTLENDKR